MRVTTGRGEEEEEEGKSRAAHRSDPTRAARLSLEFCRVACRRGATDDYLLLTRRRTVGRICDVINSDRFCKVEAEP